MTTREDLKNAIEAVQFGDMQTVRQMISNQVISCNTSDDDECTLLHWAAINNRNALLVYLIERGAKVNVLGGVLMESPLHWAVRKNFFRTVKILIQNGADPSLQSRDGVNPLLLACTLGNVEMAYFLVAHGADVNGINSQGDSLLMTLLKDQECSKLDVFRLIIKLGADGSFKDRQDGNTILHVMNTRRTRDHHKLAFVLYEAAGQEMLKVKNFHDQTPRDVLDSTKNFIMLRFYADYYQYANWSSHTPAIASFASFVFFPIMVESLGWMYGVAAYCVLHWLALDKFMELSIEFRYSKINQGATWGVILSLFVVFVMELQPYVHTNTCAFVYSIFLTICVLNVVVTNSSPKYVDTGEDRPALLAAMMASSPQEGPLPPNPSNPDEDTAPKGGAKAPLKATETMDRGLEDHSASVEGSRGRDVEEGPDQSQSVALLVDLGSEVKLCPICLVDKTLHSTHCRVCNKCQTKDYEHHCSYINNCIGEDNRRVFVFFLLACLVGILTFTYLAISIDTYVLCNNKEKYWFEWYYSIQKCMARDHKALDILSHIAAALSIWVFSITYAQCAMVAFETTTFELMNDNDDRECIPFDQVQRNVCDFVKTGRYRVSRKVKRGHGQREERWGSVVADEMQSLLEDFPDGHQHGGGCSHDHCHDHDEGNTAYNGNEKKKISKYGTRYRLGSFDA